MRSIETVVVVFAEDAASTVRTAHDFISTTDGQTELLIVLSKHQSVPRISDLFERIRYLQPPAGLSWSDEDARRQVRWELIRDYSCEVKVTWAERKPFAFLHSAGSQRTDTDKVGWFGPENSSAERPQWAQFVRPVLRPAAIGSAFTLGSVALNLLHPWPLKVAVDAVSGGTWMGLRTPASIAAAMAIASVLIVAVGATFDYGAEVITGRMHESAAANMRRIVLRRLLHMPMPFFDRYSSGELMSRLNGDVDRVQDGMMRVVTSVLPQTATLVGMTVTLFLIDPLLALVGLTAVPLLAISTLLKRKPIEQLQRDSRQRQGDLQSTTADLLRNARAIQGLGAEPWAANRYDERTDLALQASIRNVDFSARVAPASDLILAVVSGAVLWLGVTRVSSGHLSTGSLLVVFSYLSGLYSPVRELTRMGSIFARTAASRDRLSEILTHPLPAERLLSDRVPIPQPSEGPMVSVEDLSFGYEPGFPILENITLEVAQGEHLCIVGPSGRGKTTLLHLLMRLYEPTSGVIRVGGKDVRDRPLESLHSTVALVPQDCWLLDATMRENLVLDSLSITQEDIGEALRLALLDDVVARLPDGLDTRLGEGGTRLSGGERRRVALARAHLRGAEVLLFDEPTSGLDAVAEARIVESIRSMSGSRTIISVTHSRAVSAIADRVLAIADRRLVSADSLSHDDAS